MDSTDSREYMVRVTLKPLDPVEREAMRHAGTLPEDYRSRSIEDTDFVTVSAHDDDSAMRAALRETRLLFKGETALFHEVVPDRWRFLGEKPRHWT